MDSAGAETLWLSVLLERAVGMTVGVTIGFRELSEVD